MAGGLAQIVAYGAQDVYLTGQPKVTFFQSVYKRHTNFAMEAIKQSVDGVFQNGSKVSTVVARNGDLMGDTWLELPVLAGLSLTTTGNNDTVWVAERAVSQVDFIIGGQLIDRHYQTWWRLWAEVFLSESQKIAYGKMTSLPTTTGGPVMLPLLFSFCRNPSLYLPLVALQNHEIRIEFTLTSDYESYFSGPANLWSNYVYLDVEERRRLAQGKHDYLIDQVQLVSTNIKSPNPGPIRINLNQPVKEIVWCYSYSTTTEYSSMWDFSTNFFNSAGPPPTLTVDPTLIGTPLPNEVGAPFMTNGFWIEEGDKNAVNSGPMYNFQLLFNNQPRFDAQSGKYFNQYQPFRYHSGCPYPGIYVYSFALKPEDHQPSGTCNFSRIEKVEFSTNVFLPHNDINQKLFAVNYNILRIQSGMGALAFSN